MSINRVDVGTPPENFEEWTTINICFHGFADLSTTRGNGNYVVSPKFSCFGHQWVLCIYPGGRAESDEGYVAVDLANMSSTSIRVRYGYSVRNEEGREVVYDRTSNTEFAPRGTNYQGRNNTWFVKNFAKRSKLMNALVDGSLVIEVRMKDMSTGKSITQFVPTNPINKNMLELFMNQETADVVFEVGEQQLDIERTERCITSFHAHRPILQKCAPTLYEMCGVVDRGEVTTVSITDVKPDIFKNMIYNAYGGKLSDEDLKNKAKDIIDACDKYGVVHLKLEAEACYVKSTEITMDNMMDNLLYADSKNLALLKEAVMDYIVKNKHSIIGKVSFDNLPSSMMTDLLTAMARGEEQTEGGGEEDEERIKYNKMRVGTLRKKLDEKGLDVDGSREAMIALLKENDD